MFHSRWRFTKVIIIPLISNSLNTISGNLLSCQTYKAYSKNYTAAISNLMVASFFRSRTTKEDFNKYLFSYQLEDLNVNSVIYYYPRSRCTVSSIDLFLDVLLNQTLLDGKSFKIIAIFIHVDDTELKHLANILSPYLVPIIPIMPTKKSYILSIQSSYEYYDNVLLLHASMNTERPVFLENLIVKFNTKLITIFYSSEDPKSADDIMKFGEISIPPENVRKPLVF